MNKSKIIFTSFLSALGVVVYVIGVSFVIKNGEVIFGEMDGFLGPTVFLLLFVLSAAIVGSLVLGRPVLLYLENRKTEAIRVFFYTLGWLFVVTLILMASVLEISVL